MPVKKYRGRTSLLFFSLLFLAVTAVCVATNTIAFAQATPQPYVPLAPLPGTTDGGGATLQTYLPGMFKLAIGIAGVLAVIQIVIGGLQYMTTDIISSKSAARERITAAITGLLLALGAYILLNTISPNLVKFNLDIKKVEVKYKEPGPVAAPVCSLQRTAIKVCNDMGGTYGTGCSTLCPGNPADFGCSTVKQCCKLSDTNKCFTIPEYIIVQ